MKYLSKALALILAIAMVATFMVACGDKKDDSKSDGGSAADTTSADILSGSWKQTDEVNGDWTWTFDGAGKCKLVGDTTGFSGDGEYNLDESAKTLTVNMEAWDDGKVYTYTLDGDKLDLESKYSNYHLVKQ